MEIIYSAHAMAAGEDRIGGKSMGLARLSSVDAPVPPWFAVPMEFFRSHISGQALSQLLDESLARMASLDPTMGESLKTIQVECRKIQAAIVEEPLSGALTHQIEESLPPISPGPFAVRSSMVGEDSDDHSFAGQLDSFLFQGSVQDVCDSIKKCWASAFGDRSVAYHLRSGLSILDIRVGVVVQRMIDGDVSGVMFTANPMTGHRDQSLITAAWGQGEGIVSGLCNTDEFIWAHGNEELSATVADKDIMVTRAPSGVGTVEEEINSDKRSSRCLSEDEVQLIGAEGMRVADAFGKPQDIEWTIEKGQLFFVQSRPITALPAEPNTDGPRVVWDNSNIQESYCGVTTPLTFSYAVRGYESAYRQTMEAMRVPQKEIEEARPMLKNLLGLIRGRVYYNINNWYRGLLALPNFGTNKSEMEKMMGLEDPVDLVEDTVLTLGEKLARLPRMLKTLLIMLREFRRLPITVPAFLGNFDRVYKTVDRDNLKQMTFSQLMELNEVLRVEIQENWHTPIVNDFYVMMTNGSLRRLVTNTGVDNPISVQNNLLAGEDGIESTEPTHFLMRLSKEARLDEGLASLVQNGEPLESLAGIREGYPAFAAKIDEYIERYGDRVMGELKLETITLRENPSFVIEVMRNYIVRPDLDPDLLRAKEKELRSNAEALVRSRIGWLGRRRFASAARKAREAVKNRENMRLTRTRAFGLSRDIYRALGERLFEAGKLDDGRDIFYITVDEIEAYHEGRSINTSLAPLVQARKEEFASYEHQDLPHHFETVGPVYHGNQYKYEGAIEFDLNANSLKGTGCYPGVVESPIRLIFSPEDELSLNGKILCTVRTDPGWAPLFPTASGILVERGSTLSHSAVVARELGIPAIVGVPGLTSILSDAENIRMNGETGVVDRLDLE